MYIDGAVLTLPQVVALAAMGALVTMVVISTFS